MDPNTVTSRILRISWTQRSLAPLSQGQICLVIIDYWMIRLAVKIVLTTRISLLPFLWPEIARFLILQTMTPSIEGIFSFLQYFLVFIAYEKTIYSTLSILAECREIILRRLFLLS